MAARSERWSGGAGFVLATIGSAVGLGGFALAVFVGWSLPSRFLTEELQLGRAVATILRVLLRYAVPVAIALVGLAPHII